MKDFGGPKSPQWGGLIQVDLQTQWHGKAQKFKVAEKQVS